MCVCARWARELLMEQTGQLYVGSEVQVVISNSVKAAVLNSLDLKR